MTDSTANALVLGYIIGSFLAAAAPLGMIWFEEWRARRHLKRFAKDWAAQQFSRKD